MDDFENYKTLEEYKAAVNYAMKIVDKHFLEENPEQIDDMLRLYSEDVEWHAPARDVIYHGKEEIRKMYMALFYAAEGMELTPMERFATPSRVVDDSLVTFRIGNDDIQNCPYPVGTFVKMRLIHIFHVEKGMITRESGYECWTIDKSKG